jgi:N-acetyltransferase
MPPLVVPTLVGEFVHLEPLTKQHVSGIERAVDCDRSTFTYLSVPTPSEASREVSLLLEQHRTGVCVPFAQVDARSGEVVGMTRYLNIRCMPDEEVPFGVEIGGTWLAPIAQRTGINTEAKFLLMRHAFEEWQAARVDLKSDVRNERSRQAIERVGAHFEGVLRGWQPSQVAGEEGRTRDTAMYSVIASEWPVVKRNLEILLARNQ